MLSHGRSERVSSTHPPRERLTPSHRSGSGSDSHSSSPPHASSQPSSAPTGRASRPAPAAAHEHRAGPHDRPRPDDLALDLGVAQEGRDPSPRPVAARTTAAAARGRRGSRGPRRRNPSRRLIGPLRVVPWTAYPSRVHRPASRDPPTAPTAGRPRERACRRRRRARTRRAVAARGRGSTCRCRWPPSRRRDRAAARRRHAASDSPRRRRWSACRDRMPQGRHRPHTTTGSTPLTPAPRRRDAGRGEVEGGPPWRR